MFSSLDKLSKRLRTLASKNPSIRNKWAGQFFADNYCTFNDQQRCFCNALQHLERL